MEMELPLVADVPEFLILLKVTFEGIDAFVFVKKYPSSG